ncbi:Hypothetical protein PHPALM_37180 [Phytophthora palmivora]|uniref:Uncharacterized protein n=1 Tax=Phytophthora palmivora TaxID=4796 RepID=A0A2P4WY45_9STRA|nr:Hypothetical protein PHPALM_37180 [Phytophthora palmivora]
MDVHPSRLKLYADSSLEVTEELLDHIACQGTLLAVEAIVYRRINSDMNAYEYAQDAKDGMFLSAVTQDTDPK